jgi:FMN phosphatase YigB (HAD superfamily)
MLRSLFPTIEWEIVKYVGFDMDGALYDEFDFIQQVYEPIATYLSKSTSVPVSVIYERMLKRWLEKGSSYNKIFEEILIASNIAEEKRISVIEDCLNIFRSFTPSLSLSKRVSFLLDYMSQLYPLFLVTDGGPSLQTAKFNALGLSRWFDWSHVFITGQYGKEYAKPSPLIIQRTEWFVNLDNPGQVVFFGDREIDRKFAEGLGFQFVKTYCLQKEEGV